LQEKEKSRRKNVFIGAGMPFCGVYQPEGSLDVTNSLHRAGYTRQYGRLDSWFESWETEGLWRDARTKTILAHGAKQNWASDKDNSIIEKERQHARLLAMQEAERAKHIKNA
jgi:hypothetical protein